MSLFWGAVAKVVSIPAVASYLIKRSQRTPYFNLPGYMNRWWLFNGYGNDQSVPDAQRACIRRFSWLPSIRIHHILRADTARDLHDHPWDARTIILKGWYSERRLINKPCRHEVCKLHLRQPGDTAELNYGEYHSIDEVSDGGVWTMFITYKYQGTWGFLVNGVKVPWREYTNEGAACVLELGRMT